MASATRPAREQEGDCSRLVSSGEHLAFVLITFHNPSKSRGNHILIERLAARFFAVKGKMKILTSLILCFASVALADDFKTIEGKEYKDVTVSRVEPDGIVLRTKSGISKVYFVELPKDVQERFNYNAAGAAGHSARQPASQAAFQHPQTQLPSLPPVQETKDKITEEIWQFRLKTRRLYNTSKFDELEALAAQLRAERGRFGNGSWKIAQFYESLGCRADEPESMW